MNPKAVQLKRIPTHKECKWEEFYLQMGLGGEICSSDVITYKGRSDPFSFPQEVRYSSVIFTVRVVFHYRVNVRA